MAAQVVRTHPVFDVELPQPVFSGEDIDAVLAPSGTSEYTVTSDGQRFVVARAVPGTGTGPKLTVVQNWYADFPDK